MWCASDPDLAEEAAKLVKLHGHGAVSHIRDRLMGRDCSRLEAGRLTRLLREVRKLLPLDSGLDSATRRLSND